MKISFTSLVNLFLISAVLGSSFSYSNVYFFHFCLVLLVSSWILLDLSGVKRLFIKPRSHLINFFLWMIFWYALSLIWSIERSYTLVYLVYILLGVSIVYVIVGRTTSEESYQSIYNILKWTFLIEIVVALLESFTSFRLPTSPYSEYAALFGKEQTYLGLFQEEAIYNIKNTPTAFHGNPNNLAVAMVTILPFFLLYDKLIIKIGGFLVILIIVIMTGSRGSFIGLIFGLTIYFAIVNFKRFLILLFLTILGSGIFFKIIDQLKLSENAKISGIVNSGDAIIQYLTVQNVYGRKHLDSVSARQELIINGLEALYSTYGLGVGGGGNRAVQEQLGGVSGRLSSMHNFWIEVLVDSGVVFFVSFVIWYLIVSLNLLFIYFKSTSLFYKYQSAALFISFSIFSVACISASSVIYHLPMWIMFGMGLSLINIWSKRQSNKKLVHKIGWVITWHKEQQND